MIVDKLPGGERVWAVNWGRLARQVALLLIPTLAVMQLIANATSGSGYGADFRVGILKAGADVLHGRSPYPPPDPHRLLLLVHGFITPPPLALLAVPFSLLPFPLAVTLWNVMCGAALCLALRVMGVRDVRIYLLALASAPMIDSLENGQPDAIFALIAALTWRYRDSWHGGVAAGALIAAKLLAWPLVIWMLVTRRIQSVAVTLGSTVLILLGSWACIGFKGLADYPSLLAADARAFETWPGSYSLVQALTPLGLSTTATRALAVAVAVAVALAIIAFAYGRDEGWFAAALTFGVLASPVLWTHYLVVLFVPLAFARRRQLTIWIVTAYTLWVTLAFLPTASRAVALPVAMSMLVMWATATRRRTDPGLDPTAPLVGSVPQMACEPANATALLSGGRT